MSSIRQKPVPLDNPVPLEFDRQAMEIIRRRADVFVESPETALRMAYNIARYKGEVFALASLERARNLNGLHRMQLHANWKERRAARIAKDLQGVSGPLLEDGVRSAAFDKPIPVRTVDTSIPAGATDAAATAAGGSGRIVLPPDFDQRARAKVIANRHIAPWERDRAVGMAREMAILLGPEIALDKVKMAWNMRSLIAMHTKAVRPRKPKAVGATAGSETAGMETGPETDPGGEGGRAEPNRRFEPDARMVARPKTRRPPPAARMETDVPVDAQQVRTQIRTALIRNVMINAGDLDRLTDQLVQASGLLGLECVVSIATRANGTMDVADRLAEQREAVERTQQRVDPAEKLAAAIRLQHIAPALWRLVEILPQYEPETKFEVQRIVRSALERHAGDIAVQRRIISLVTEA